MTHPDLALLDAGLITARRIYRGASTDEGAVQVLGKWYRPEAPNGLNGDRGWQSGSYERRLNEEGKAGLILPNAEGSDGVLHRRRFKLFTQDDYRFGEEWVELYREGDTDPFVVFSPDSGQIGKQIEVAGHDATWLLKRVRDGAAGWWKNAPLDVMRFYGGVWQVLYGDDFNATSMAFSTSQQVTADGKLRYLRCETDQTRLPGSVRMRAQPGTISVFSLEGASVGNQALDDQRYWRMEIEFRLLTAPTANDSIEIGVNQSTLGTIYTAGSELGYVIAKLQADQVTLRNVGSLGTRTTKRQTWDPDADKPPTTTFTFAIEHRGDWAYVYLQGELVSVMWGWDPDVYSFNVGDQIFVRATADAGDEDDLLVEVRRIMVRQWKPAVVSLSDRRLPGAPPPGGLLAEYYDFRSLKVYGGAVNLLGAPGEEVSDRKVEASVAFPTNPRKGILWPQALGIRDFGVILSGSAYFDLAAYDYKLKLQRTGTARLWLGKTRYWQDRIISGAWPAHLGMTSTYTSALLRTHLGASLTGWYPLRIDYGVDQGSTSGLGVRYERQDQVGLWVPLGCGSYPHTVYAEAALTELWQLDDLTATTGTAFVQDSKGNGTRNGTHQTNGMKNAVGPVQGSRATWFDGAADYLTLPDGTGTDLGNAFAIEFWIKRNRSGTAETILDKGAAAYEVRINASNQVVLAVGAGGAAQFDSSGTWGAPTVATTITDKKWHHVLITWGQTDGFCSMYIDGVECGRTISISSPFANNATALNVGRRTGGSNFFNGGLYGVATYSALASLAAAQAMATAHTNARWDQPHVPVSPVGIHSATTRFESHFEQLRSLTDDWAYQWLVQPKSLESGQFPGVITPAVRLGRDTELTITDDDLVTTPDRAVTADDLTDALLMDGQGLGDQQSQLTVEDIAFDMLDHLVLHEDYESGSDLALPQMLLQRLDSLLALRRTPWEVVGAAPPGQRQLLDSLPLTGNLTKFAYDPGDGVKLALDALDVDDGSPRQIMSIEREFTPAGVKVPTLGFRQRPRNFVQTLKRALREVRSYKRNYQTQYSVVSGNPARTPTNADTPTDLSKAPLPKHLRKVLSAALVVHTNSSTSDRVISVNGVATSVNVIAGQVGRIDLTGYIARESNTNHRMTVSVAAPASGVIQYSLEILVRI